MLRRIVVVRRKPRRRLEKFTEDLARDLIRSFRPERDTARQFLKRSKSMAVVMFPRAIEKGSLMSRKYLYRNILETCRKIVSNEDGHIRKLLQPVISDELETMKFWYHSVKKEHNRKGQNNRRHRRAKPKA